MLLHLQTSRDCSVSFTAKFSNDPKLSIDVENSMVLGFWEMTLNLVLTWIIYFGMTLKKVLLWLWILQ